MIRVKALQTGIYGITRYKEGAEFTIRSMDDLGKWMKVIDEGVDDEKPKSKRAAIKLPAESESL